MSDTNLKGEGAAAPRRTHRNYTLEFKQKVVRETLLPGASVSVVARRRDINANVVFEWRKLHREGKLGPHVDPAMLDEGAARLLPVSIIDPPDAPLAKQVASANDAVGVCDVEVEVGKRVVRIRGLSMARAEQFLRECLR